jgi:hypothetical protein
MLIALIKDQMQFEGSTNRSGLQKEQYMNASKDFGPISPIYYPLHLPQQHARTSIRVAEPVKENSSNTPQRKACSPI